MTSRTETTERQLPPTIFVLFGATGDLAHRMVIPAFYALSQRGLLPEKWLLVGSSRKDKDDASFQKLTKDSLEEFGKDVEAEGEKAFLKQLRFAGKGFTKDDPGELVDAITSAKDEIGQDAQVVFYLAVPPKAFAAYTEAIGAHDLAKGSRVVYEKPFGTDPDDFEQLDKLAQSILDEDQIYRIDHFLGKEATQNLHVLRFANDMFANIWNRRHIEQVQIDVPETLDVADRADFYDATGAALDMLVTHIYQVVAEVAIEPPVDLSAENLQSARADVLKRLRKLDMDEVVLGQYEGYTDLEDVPDDSTTDTFVAARLWVDTDRWKGVPFVVRTGKCLAHSAQVVSLILREPESPLTDDALERNVVTISLKGSGGIEIGMTLKRPGPTLDVAQGNAQLALENVDPGQSLDPYAALIEDVLAGDRSLFTTAESLRYAWRAFKPLLGDDRPKVTEYPKGSWGPDAADSLTSPLTWVLEDRVRKNGSAAQ